MGCPDFGEAYESIALAPDLDFGSIQAKVIVNGKVRNNVLGSEVIDNQLQTIAWLANALHRFGRRLEAGQQIMSGSFTKPVPISAGDAIQTQFSGVGTVKASFV